MHQRGQRIGIKDTRIDCSSQRIANQEEVSSCNNLCGSLQLSLIYIYLQKSTKAEETLAAKISFERLAERHGVKVQAYQADNGRFSETTFMQAIKDAGQTITFCGVNAHFQNRIAERTIRSLQDQARMMLIHAQHRWPTAIDAHLWPYALRTANEIFNNALRNCATLDS